MTEKYVLQNVKASHCAKSSKTPFDWGALLELMVT